MSRAHRISAPIRLGAWLAATLALLWLCAAGPARADGDPASDELIAQNVFYPYSSVVPDAAQRRLNAAVAAAHRHGIALKVALIARRSDLGSIAALYGAPQRYAAFLDTELSYERKVPLLVVMPDGFGTAGLALKVRRAVLATHRPAAGTGPALTAAAMAAVARIDSQRGAMRTPRSNASRGSAVGTRTVLLLALILAALLVGGLLVVARVFFPPTA